jgi:FkbH-like protein
LEGIHISRGDAAGEAYIAVQEIALALRERGVILAVSSKNTDSIARRPFREHPDMLLKENHITVFQANWKNKPDNIRAIAEELSLGYDSLVLLDDSRFERDLVRQELPEVAVPELDHDPANYPRTLAAAGYFELLRFSSEDRERAEMYQGNARRRDLLKQVSDVESYLKSLDMRIIFSCFDHRTRSRVSQLINKSNQFNLTTRRYTNSEVAEVEIDPQIMSLHARLVDKFGDNGIISVVICRPGNVGDIWIIDTWLMSCRVLGRQVENMVLHEICLRAREQGISELIGIYRPTSRNELVRDHYQKLGFALVKQEADGTTSWTLKTDTLVDTPPVVVERIPGRIFDLGSRQSC